MSTASSEKAMKKSARIAKHVNGHAATEETGAPVTHEDVRSDAVQTKSTKKARAGKGDSVGAAVVGPQNAVPEKAKRQKKEKVVRDSFTMPKSDYEKLAKLKQKCLDAGVAAKKSELLRAGLAMLDAASRKQLLKAVAAIETVKTGRPAQS
jgi:hypothetical protein